ncbi:hypothetical protein CVT25_005876 [Psilocybe cyanescens]|uniref:Rab-GAP TBC domain-containing protein n=1 Tax=Psilocybe cyanescens TaxID=93625 RepID=A0A409VLZ5_PSICY|nr:hypothetical protein CVT25_005876 [Psilocybe cyanescens]
MTTEHTFNLPPAVAVGNRPDPLDLDALRSPQVNQTFNDRSLARESVAVTEFNDIALDDDTFSPIALTARPGNQDTPPQSEHESSRRPTSTSLPNISTLEFSPSKSHRKTASTTTIRSGHEPTVSLFMNRLDLQESGGRARGSIDGQVKLQEEFARLHEKESEVNATKDGAIDWDFWGAVISDYGSFASKHPEELAQAIQRGIPPTLRGMMWQHMAASKDPELETTYLNLLKEPSKHEKAIKNDLGRQGRFEKNTPSNDLLLTSYRTLPHHAVFTDGQGIGQENLYNVLKAYSLQMPDEEAFSLLVRLMSVYDLQGHFLPEMPKLHMRLFDRLVEDMLPVLHVHFLRQGIKSTMYCSQWFLTLFSYRFPLDIVFRIYDNCLANGIEAIFGFSITLLQKNEEALLSLKFDEILAFLNTKLLDCYLIDGESDLADDSAKYRVDDFVTDAVSLRITPFMLDCYRHEYEDNLREINKHAIQIDELRSSNRSLSSQVKTLENSLAQLNVEHVEILNELVKQRLKNEEMEEELVRYKLLYAEAMHQQEGANSSNRISLAQMMQSLKRGSSG